MGLLARRDNHSDDVSVHRVVVVGPKLRFWNEVDWVDLVFGEVTWAKLGLRIEGLNNETEFGDVLNNFRPSMKAFLRYMYMYLLNLSRRQKDLTSARRKTCIVCI